MQYVMAVSNIAVVFIERCGGSRSSQDKVNLRLAWAIDGVSFRDQDT